MNAKNLINQITVRKLREAYHRNNWIWYENGRLNIFGIRNSDMTAGVWNDVIGVYYFEKKQHFLYLFKGTVDPGTYYLNNPMNPAGTAVMKFGQYLEAYQEGLHAGKYEALRQVKPIYFYRISKQAFEADGGKEIKLTGKPLVYALIGGNIHRANIYSIPETVGMHSAGCQVIRVYSDWLVFMGVIKKNPQTFYDYTLMGDRELKLIDVSLDPKNEKRV